MNYFWVLLLTLFALSASASVLMPPELKPAWREDFSNYEKEHSGRLIPKGWELKGKPFTPTTVFDLTDGNDSPLVKGKVLRMVADKATGSFLYAPKKVDLKKYPVMRWCWCAEKLPDLADGRDPKKDDQVIGIYLGTGRLSQDSIAYRWETKTPKGSRGKVSYGGGFVSVQWFAVRNDSDPLNTWVVETRNVAKDFQDAYGYLPEKFGISVVSNSQNTGTVSEAKLAWVEFLPAAVLDVNPDTVLIP